METSSSDSESDTRKYYDIVAARTSSLSSVPVEAATGVENSNGSVAIKAKMPSESALSVTPPSAELEEDENLNPWQTVKRKMRRRASLESLSKLRKAGKKGNFFRLIAL